MYKIDKMAAPMRWNESNDVVFLL